MFFILLLGFRLIVEVEAEGEGGPKPTPSSGSTPSSSCSFSSCSASSSAFRFLPFGVAGCFIPTCARPFRGVVPNVLDDGPATTIISSSLSLSMLTPTWTWSIGSYSNRGSGETLVLFGVDISRCVLLGWFVRVVVTWDRRGCGSRCSRVELYMELG